MNCSIDRIYNEVNNTLTDYNIYITIPNGWVLGNKIEVLPPNGIS